MTACLLMPWRGTDGSGHFFLCLFSGAVPRIPVFLFMSYHQMNKRDAYDTGYVFTRF